MASISSSSGVSSALTAKTGIGGLVSGMDIDSLVESMTAISRQKITNQQQAIQKLEWKQTAYRSVISAFKEFQTKYLDLLSNTNLRSASFFNTTKATSSSEAVTVATTSSASAGTTTINSVTQLATFAKVAGSGASSAPLTGTTSVSDIISGISGSGLKAGDSISVNLDGRVRTITFDASFFSGLDANNFVGKLQGLVDTAFGSGMITVSGTGNNPLTFSAPTGSRLTLNSIALSKPITGTTSAADFVAGVRGAGLKSGDSFNITLDGKSKTITFDDDFISGLDNNNFAGRLQGLVDTAFEPGKITVSGTGTDPLTFTAQSGSSVTLGSLATKSTALTDLGITSGQSNKLNLSSEIGKLSLISTMTAGSDGGYHFTINGVKFDVKSTDSLSSVINKINSSKAGVTLSYSSVTDQFSMKATTSGAGNTLAFSDGVDGGNFLASLGLNQSDVEAGVNAELSVNGVAITRSSNTFNVDGVDITLNSIPTDPVTITTTGDSSKLTDTIKKFVEDYNSLIGLVNGLVQEEAYRDYPPLTEDQKKDMSESEIASWEKKAKSGILKGDATLRNIATKLQSTISGLSVNGVSLYTMGISTGSYTDNGKLKIDEAKLKNALEYRGGEIRELFTSTNGLANALNGIIDGAAKTSGVKGTRGLLVELAGMDNTASSTQNSIFDQIKSKNKNIDTLKSRLSSEESRLWNRFSAMESVINNLNSQSSYLTSFTNK